MAVDGRSSVETKPRTALQRQKKQYTQKGQLIANQKTAEIVATAFSQGSKHDLQLFKDAKLDIAEHIRILANAGYQGLADLHENCQTPFKKSKYHPLPKKEQQHNRSLARKRIVIDHNFRKLKPNTPCGLSTCVAALCNPKRMARSDSLCATRAHS